MTTSTFNPPSKLQQRLAGALGLALLLVLWELASRRLHPLILPSPKETWRALEGLWRDGSLTANLALTLGRTVGGFGLALLAGCALAALSQSTSLVQALLRPLVAVVQIIPPVVWMVLAVIWFGIASGRAAAFVIFIVTLPLTFAQSTAGLEGIDVKLVEMARVYRCSPGRILTHIYLPALLPQLAAAVGVGFSFAWKAAVFAEFMGSNSGVGFLLSTANSNLETDKVFAWVLVLIAVMLACEYGLLQPLRRRAARWSG